MNRLDKRLLDFIFQFTDVSRPVVAEQGLFGIAAELELASPILCAVAFQEFLGQEHHVLTTLPERRHLDRHDLNTEIKIFAEFLFFDSFFEVHMGSRNHPHIHGNFPVVPYAGNVLFLQHPQEFHLHVQRQFPDLVQKDGASVGFFEIPLAVIDGSRKRTLGMPEQQGFDKVFRNSPAVHRNKRLVASGTVVVQVAGKDLFARARLPADNDRQGQGRQAIRQGYKVFHDLRRIDDAVFADHVLEHVQGFLVPQAVKGGKGNLFADRHKGIEQLAVGLRKWFRAGGPLQIQVP